MGVRAAGFALAVGATGLAFGLAFALAPIIGTGGEPLFLLAIAASALIGGLWPGLLALALSLAALNWWFIPPERAFGFASSSSPSPGCSSPCSAGVHGRCSAGQRRARSRLNSSSRVLRAAWRGPGGGRQSSS